MCIGAGLVGASLEVGWEMLRRRREDELKDTVYPSDPHTRVKHNAYRYYLGCWMAKILRVFPGGATIVDAFAGSGIYSDGLDGSPILVAKTYLGHRALDRLHPLDLICLEEREDRVACLRQQFATLPTHPKLRYTVLDAGRLEDNVDSLARMAHRGDRRRPVLWLLDPYKPSELAFSVVRKCLAGSKDEAVITFFAEHMNRFGRQPSWEPILDDHFGSPAWRAAAEVEGPADVRKAAFASAYRDVLQSEHVETGVPFAVQVHRETARYFLILATHSIKGLECWNGNVLWRMDPNRGAGASSSSLDQISLFDTPALQQLRDKLLSFVGEECSWGQLVEACHRLGFKETHLRQVLDELADEGVAFRTQPVTVQRRAHQWPDGCHVRFYPPLPEDEEGEAGR